MPTVTGKWEPVNGEGGGRGGSQLPPHSILPWCHKFKLGLTRLSVWRERLCKCLEVFYRVRVDRICESVCCRVCVYNLCPMEQKNITCFKSCLVLIKYLYVKTSRESVWLISNCLFNIWSLYLSQYLGIPKTKNKHQTFKVSQAGDGFLCQWVEHVTRTPDMSSLDK